MSELLADFVGGVEGLADRPLDFIQNMAGVFQNRLIAAFEKPIPEQDPISAYRYLNGRRKLLEEGTRQKPLVRMQDKNYSQLATIGQEMSCYFEEIAADSGEAGCVIRGGDYLGDFVRNATRLEEDLHLSIDPIGTAPDWPTRWGGKITSINIKRDSSGIHTCELIATSNREHLKRILVGSTPFFPPEVQPIRMWMMPANIRTGCAITFFINIARLFFPPLSIVTNLFNPGGWINPLGPDALLNLDPLSWPIQCQFVNFLLDQSRTSLITGAWTNFHDVTTDPLKDAGACARVYTYFTDDPTNPHPELAELVGPGLADLARPHRNALIAAFEDHSGHEGPTGTALDGPLNFISKTLDDLITTTVLPVDEDDDGEVDPVFQKVFGTVPKKPWAIFPDGQESGIIESQYSQHKGPTKTIMTGGRSPKLVNDLQTFGIKYMLSKISELFYTPTGLAVGSVNPPGSPGLEELYQGQLDNILFAWMRYTDIFRALGTGDMAYQEWFEHPGSSAYTISAVLNLRLGNFKKRAWRTFKTSIRNCAPYIINYDIMLYDRVGFEVDGILYVDQASAIKYEYDRNKPITYSLSIGDDSKDVDPFAQGIKALQAVYAVASMAAGEGWLFD